MKAEIEFAIQNITECIHTIGSIAVICQRDCTEYIVLGERLIMETSLRNSIHLFENLPAYASAS